MRPKVCVEVSWINVSSGLIVNRRQCTFCDRLMIRKTESLLCPVGKNALQFNMASFLAQDGKTELFKNPDDVCARKRLQFLFLRHSPVRTGRGRMARE